jgi:hypothetical protein
VVLFGLLVLSSLARAQGPGKVGFIYPDSGFAAQLGLDLRDGFVLYWSEVGNKAGGRPVEVHLESKTSCEPGPERRDDPSAAITLANGARIAVTLTVGGVVPGRGRGARRCPHRAARVALSGFLYSMDFADDDIPYVVERPGGRLVAIPYQYDLNDMGLSAYTRQPPSVYFEFFRRKFDYLYAEGMAGDRRC